MKAKPVIAQLDTEYARLVEFYPHSYQCLPRFLRELRRTIAKDGPHQQVPGALESFDKACKLLGVPFIEP